MISWVQLGGIYVPQAGFAQKAQTLIGHCCFADVTGTYKTALSPPVPLKAWHYSVFAPHGFSGIVNMQLSFYSASAFSRKCCEFL